VKVPALLATSAHDMLIGPGTSDALCAQYLLHFHQQVPFYGPEPAPICREEASASAEDAAG